LELKRSTSELKEAIISIGAILNKHGNGRLYFGIKNDGSVVGQQIGQSTLRDVSTAISNHIEPRIHPKIQLKRIQNKQCILVDFRSDDSPYFTYGRAYIRVADEDKQISVKEIEMKLRYSKTGLKYIIPVDSLKTTRRRIS